MPSGCSGGKPQSWPSEKNRSGGAPPEAASAKSRARARCRSRRRARRAAGRGRARHPLDGRAPRAARRRATARRRGSGRPGRRRRSRGSRRARARASSARRAVRLVVRAEAGVVGELRMLTEVRLELVAARAGLGEQRAGERLQHRPPQVLRSGVVDVRALGERAALAPEGPRGEQLPRRGRALELRARREVGVELVPEEPARRRVGARLVRERREQGRAADQIPSEPADIAQQRLEVSQVGDPHRPLRAQRVERQEDAPRWSRTGGGANRGAAITRTSAVTPPVSRRSSW